MRPTPPLPIQGDRPRILIIRMSALGDIVFATSLLGNLRNRFPQAHIAWLAQKEFAGVIENDPRLDHLIPVQRQTLASPRALLRLRRQLTDQQYDWVIDCQGLLKSRIFARLAEGATRIGFDSKEPGASFIHYLLPRDGVENAIAPEYRYLAERITGVPADPPLLPVSSPLQNRIAEAMSGMQLAPGFIALCPFTTRPQKHWITDYWPQLGHKLSAAGLGPCVIFGGPANREEAAAIHARLPASSINLAGQTRLGELAAWLSQAGLVIGVDTGLTHIGIAVRRPTIALFGSTRPYTAGADSPLEVLYEDMPCAPCRRNPSCGGDWTCMRRLTPERVAESAIRILANEHSS